jgi:hypothetical protein
MFPLNVEFWATFLMRTAIMATSKTCLEQNYASSHLNISIVNI